MKEKYEQVVEHLDRKPTCLNLRQQRVLRLRFGLEDGRQKTLEEAAGILNFTRERIRLIESIALRKIGHQSVCVAADLEEEK
jgi:DNA-directed RNA polymerase sigma subunit (sigma70/sigma32)